ncbi:phosphoadenylyl-sulfate reductase [Caldibacillus lycopersici]|uniref:Adenosine 5'-phosphosulfate reductase n=1 Tax=Perspicuibacillus lycopersici TaxID=1325689 RepID=A0AAE3IWL6_9BACI|nr:phosphoadenylyl-sulfate reductase [Perspicuibacillus lycopersici]MCU9614736.1 phosphoadenylyl-sulfate reductase [Perspicuibacillus lycopersici]
MLNGFRDYFDVIKWAYEQYQDDEIVYACSFGAEGIVLIDLISKVKKDAKIKFLDTGLHFKETYELIEKIKKRYPRMQIEMVQPNISLSEQAKWYGEELWKVNPNLCCYIRKVVPLKEALNGAKAWFSGLRREQSLSRSKTEYINKDEKFKQIKICPLIHWKWDDILTYIELNHLPYNPLHDKGYLSIGCAPCTLPVSEGDDTRAGRWAGQNKTECGLHQG